jgi:hypothetical protein
MRSGCVCNDRSRYLRCHFLFLQEHLFMVAISLFLSCFVFFTLRNIILVLLVTLLHLFISVVFFNTSLLFSSALLLSIKYPHEKDQKNLILIEFNTIFRPFLLNEYVLIDIEHRSIIYVWKVDLPSCSLFVDARILKKRSKSYANK